MKYQQALQQKEINVENLSKSLQNQISKLEADWLKVKNAESEELGEEEKALIEDAKKELVFLDENLATKILKFNVELQQRREAIMRSAIQAKMEKKKEQPKESPKVAEQPKQETSKVAEQQPKETPKSEPKEALKQQEQPKALNNVSVKEKLQHIESELKEQPIIQHQKVVQQQPSEHEEFARVQIVKKKRNGFWFALVGAGALAMTWGAVNIFKNNR